MIVDTARALATLGLAGARQVPVLGRLAGTGTLDRLDGRTVFVTGAARGLGAAIARDAHSRGANVALVGRRLAGVEALADVLGERAAPFEADVVDAAALGEAAAGTVQRFGGIDVVVANAGIAPPSEPVLTIDTAEFERTVEVDLLGQWRTVRATLPHVVAARGHVTVISSIYAFFNGALNASYAASKAGIEQLTRALRVELAHHGATAGVAYLGFVDTDLAADAFAQPHVERMRQAFPALLTRPISADDAARAVVDGIERRSARVGAPGWVLPMLAARGVTTAVMDEVLLANTRLRQIVRDAEAGSSSD